MSAVHGVVVMYGSILVRKMTKKQIGGKYFHFHSTPRILEQKANDEYKCTICMCV